MNDSLRESLSALMDNEGDELELRRALKTLDDSPDAAESWRRYHLARSLMQRDREIDVATDLSAGIMARIEHEPVPRMPAGKQPSRHGSFSFAGSAAVAAAVSLMVITGAQFYSGFNSSEPSEVADRSANDDGIIAASSTLAGSSSSPGGAISSLPLFQAPPGLGNGLMSVGVSNEPLFMAPNQRQSQRSDLDQARLLQSYLDRHANGAAYRSGEAWMPLLRASAQDTLSTR